MLLPDVASRSQAKYSQMSPVRSVSVSSQIIPRSVALLGLVKPSIAGVAVPIEPSFVSDELTGPSSLMLPTGSWNSKQQFASGTTPSILNDACAKTIVGVSRKTAAIFVTIAVRFQFSVCRLFGKSISIHPFLYPLFSWKRLAALWFVL